MVPSVKTEVQSLEKVDDGVRVVVSVDAPTQVPDAFQEIRARARALLATGFATSGGEILEDVELGEVERLTELEGVQTTDDRTFSETKEFTVMVDFPL